MAKCLFCTTPCVPQDVKSEVFITPEEEDPLGSSSSPEGEAQPSQLQFDEDSVITDKVKGFLILKNILKIPQETLAQFLQQNGGHFDTRGWMNLCSACEESVLTFYQALKEISKLEKKLAGIETELKWKIQSSKDVVSENPTGEQIRNAVITGSQWITIEVPSGSEFEISLGVFPEAAPEFVKEEVIEGGSWAEQLPEQSSSLFLDQMDEGESPQHIAPAPVVNASELPPRLPPPPPPVNIIRPPYIPPPQKAKARVSSDESCYTTPKKLKTSFTDRSKTRRYTCTQCPYDSTNLLRFEKHMKIHAPGSEAVICDDCGWYILPTSVSRHRAQAHPQLRVVGDKKREPKKGRLCWLQCPECSALIAKIEDYRDHERMHETGVGEVCEECNWLCKRLSSHSARWHPKEENYVRHKYPRYIKLMEKRANAVVKVEESK